MTHAQKRSRSVRIKFRDLLVIQTVMEEVDLTDREQATKDRIDVLVDKSEEWAKAQSSGRKDTYPDNHRADELAKRSGPPLDAQGVDLAAGRGKLSIRQ